MEAARRYDAEAWEALYRRVHRPLLGYALRRLRAREAAEDAVSETMTRALDRIELYTWKGAGFEAWLFGILRCVVHETWRRQARDERTSDVPAPVSADPIADSVLGREEVDQVRKAFAALTPDEQEILELRVVAALSADDVAAVQGRRPGAVRMAQHRAVARLRAALTEVSGD